MSLTPTGYVRTRLEEFIDEITSEFNQKFGNINTEADSLLGQFISVIAEQFNVMEQKLEDVYFSQYIATAEGNSLDFAVQSLNLERIKAVATSVDIIFYGDEGTTIPQGSQVAQNSNAPVFVTNQAADIELSTTRDTTVSLATSVTGENYIVVINGITFNKITDALDTPNSINNDLAADINASSDVDITATVDGAELRLVGIENFNLTVSSQFTVEETGTGIASMAADTGAISAPANSLDFLITPISGVDRVNNLTAGVLGRDRETDVELRARALGSPTALSRSTAEAIRLYVEQNVPAVQSVRVFENRSMVEDNGRPPKSYEVVVEGGDDELIAGAIFEAGPAGIQAFGDTTVVVETSGGDIAIGFTRPEEVFIFIQAVLTVVPGEFPLAGIDAVSQNLFELGGEQAVGQDVLWQSYFEAIYQVPGVTSANLIFAESSNPNTPGPFSSTNISIGMTAIAVLNLDNIQVSTWV